MTKVSVTSEVQQKLRQLSLATAVLRSAVSFLGGFQGSRNGPATFIQRKKPIIAPTPKVEKGMRRAPGGCRRMVATMTTMATSPRKYGSSHPGRPIAREIHASSSGIGWDGEPA